MISLKALITQIDPSLNRKILAVASIIAIIIWILFKLLFENVNMVLDSYYYVYAADKKLNVNIWPIGYSYFLRLIGQISHSSFLLISFQYIFFQLSLFYFYISVNRIYKFSLAATILYCLLAILNPIIPFTSNFILSDAVFAGLSIIWLSQLLHLIYSPQNYIIFSNAILLVLLIAVRYNALYYPIISIAAFLLCKRNISFKITGIFTQSLLIIIFITFICSEVKKMTGLAQFSPYGSWKLANNALYMYDNIEKENATPPQLFQLNKVTKDYFNHPHEHRDLLILDYTSGSWYMFDYESPLLIYMHSTAGYDTTLLGIKQFGKFGPIMHEYGSYIIKKHPLEYARHFMFPNIIRYLMPPLEIYWKLSPFSFREDYLGQVTKKWFKINTLAAPYESIEFRNYIFYLFPILIFGLHTLFFFNIVIYSFTIRKKKLNTNVQKLILLLLIFWITDFGFNVFASGVVLRYLILTALIEFIIIILMIRLIWEYLFLKDDSKSGINHTQ